MNDLIVLKRKWKMIRTNNDQEKYRQNPIFGNDMSLPASLLVQQFRDKLIEARGLLKDIQYGYGWGDHINNLEGLINCGLIVAHSAKEDIAAAEIRWDDKKYGPSVHFSSRGIGVDSCPGCFVCGSVRGVMANIAAFVKSREDGEKVVGWIGNGAWLVHESNRIQVKIGACKSHESALEKLSKLTNVHNVIRESMIHEVAGIKVS